MDDGSDSSRRSDGSGSNRWIRQQSNQGAIEEVMDRVIKRVQAIEERVIQSAMDGARDG